MITPWVLAGTLLMPAVPGMGATSARPSASSDEEPPETKGAGITEKLGASLSDGIRSKSFTDPQGNAKPLSSWLADGQRPSVLTFNYSDCPMLCSVQLQGLTRTLKGVSLAPGQDFNIITVTLDPKETAERAGDTQSRYRELLGVDQGWTMLRAAEADVKALADEVGFGYRLDEESGEYIHTATNMILTPDGRVSRYLYGVTASPKTAELSLVEASKGRLGTPLDQVLLYCFQYDPNRGAYTPVVINLMKMGGALMLVAMAVAFGVLTLRSRQRTAAQGAT